MKVAWSQYFGCSVDLMKVNHTCLELLFFVHLLYKENGVLVFFDFLACFSKILVCLLQKQFILCYFSFLQSISMDLLTIL